MDQRLLLNGVRHPERLEGVSGDELEQLLQTLPAFEAGQLLNLRRLKANHSSRLPMVTDRMGVPCAEPNRGPGARIGGNRVRSNSSKSLGLV